MAVTKILARHGRLDLAIKYVLNEGKTNQDLTVHLNCDPGLECWEMLETKRHMKKLDGVQYYHLIQSFKPGEITPKLALEIAQKFAEEHLEGYEAVVAVHTDKDHIHAHMIFNSVNMMTGQKYHSNAQSYYQQIQAISDRLCREHGLSVIMRGEASQSVSYIEWLRQSKGQPTFRTMLEADLRAAIEQANDLGHFFLLMEHQGYEISHGNRLGFRLRGQERFMYPGRKNPLFTEEGIRAAIHGNLEAIEAGQKVFIHRPIHYNYRHPKYKGFLALYVHYLYVLGKIEKRQYPPKMTPQLRKDVMRFEQYREQFAFLRDNNLASPANLADFQTRTEETLANLMKQRTILNVRKRKRKRLYDALADEEALAPTKSLYEDGLSGMESEFSRYMDAVATLDQCDTSREALVAEKADIYGQLAEINRSIRAERKKLALCAEIQDRLPQMERTVQKIESKEVEVKKHEHRRR